MRRGKRPSGLFASRFARITSSRARPGQWRRGVVRATACRGGVANFNNELLLTTDGASISGRTLRAWRGIARMRDRGFVPLVPMERGLFARPEDHVPQPNALVLE